jgi:very-short-patch-repair endonuclease
LPRRKAQLREPEVNVRMEGYEVDFLWRVERLVIEIDGRAFHSSDRSFENDRRRDAVLLAAGLRVMRVTWRQIVREPEALLVRLVRALMT